jgi:hypothetical protein
LKFLQRMIGALFLTLMVVAVTLATTWYTVDQAISRWMQQPLPIASKINQQQDDGQAQSIPAQDTPPPQALEAMATGQSDPSATAPTPNAPLEQEVSTDVQSNSGTVPKVVISAEQFAQRKDLLTNQERLRIYELFTKHLPENRLQDVSQWLENGLTDEEISKLSGLLQTHFPQAARVEIESIWLRWQPLPSKQP